MRNLPTPTELITLAVLAPVMTLFAVWAARRIGQWLARALAKSFADTVSQVVAPDLARLGTRLGTSIDDLRIANHQEHTDVQRRLRDIERNQSEVVERLAGLERLAGRRRQSDYTHPPAEETP